MGKLFQIKLTESIGVKLVINLQGLATDGDEE